MQKDFITVTPDSGNGNGTVTVAASQNPTTSQRSSFIEVSGGGITRRISVNQESGGTVISIKGASAIQGRPTLVCTFVELAILRVSRHFPCNLPTMSLPRKACANIVNNSFPYAFNRNKSAWTTLLEILL